jgi:amino acid permease
MGKAPHPVRPSQIRRITSMIAITMIIAMAVITATMTHHDHHHHHDYDFDDDDHQQHHAVLVIRFLISVLLCVSVRRSMGRV